jgi:hypothetical protein
MIVTIHQPNYFPWLGLLDKIAKADVFVLLDNVQATKDSHQYRNLFYCHGQQVYLTLPVNYSLGKLISELCLKNDNWKEKHLHFLKNYYAKAQYYNEIYPLIETLFNSFNNDHLIDLLDLTIELSLSLFDIRVKILRSSTIDGHGNYKGEITVDICRKLNATQYLSGQGAIAYMTGDLEKAFSASDIGILWHTFSHPTYKQENGKPFVPGLSCLDMLFFNGIEKSREIFWNNVRKNTTFSQ